MCLALLSEFCSALPSSLLSALLILCLPFSPPCSLLKGGLLSVSCSAHCSVLSEFNNMLYCRAHTMLYLGILLSARMPCSLLILYLPFSPPCSLKGSALLNGSVGKLGWNLILLNQSSHLLLDPTHQSNELNWNEFNRNENAMNHHQNSRHVAVITTFWGMWRLLIDITTLARAVLWQFVTHSRHQIPS